MILAGIVLVLPRRPWVEKLFSPLVYPFVCADSEFPAVIDWVLDNLDDCRRKLEPIKEMIAKRNSWEAFCGKFQAVYELIEKWPTMEPFRRFRDMTVDLLVNQNRRSIDFSSLLEATKDFRTWTATKNVFKVRCAYACFQAIRHMDDMSSAVPFLVASDADFEWLKRQKAVSGALAGDEK